MYGLGIIKGLGTTLRHMIGTYVEDMRWLGRRRYGTPQGIAFRSSKEARGIFTIQYPEEKLPSPEEFRYLPFLVYEQAPGEEPVDRCTACGICAKVCPPQCIWIVRTTDAKTGRPIPAPAEFWVDVDVCMNCGLCAEYCPFDAIKMDHDYEIAAYDRRAAHLFDKARLSKPVSYYASIRPTAYAREEAERSEMQARKTNA